LIEDARSEKALAEETTISDGSETATGLVQSSSESKAVGALSQRPRLPLGNLEHAYIVAKSTHYGHELSFEKFSNCGWQNALHFSNGGLSVNLLRFNMNKKSSVKRTISAYKEIDAFASRSRGANNRRLPATADDQPKLE
jgi:hypothetical protein